MLGLHRTSVPPLITSFIFFLQTATMGIGFSINVVKRGYYPKGGGIVELEVFPAKKLSPIILDKRESRKIKLTCSYSKLSQNFITNQIKNIEKIFLDRNFRVETKIIEEQALDLGASLLVSVIDKSSIIGIDSIYDPKTKKFNFDGHELFQNQNTVDSHLADMIVLPASLAKGITIFHVDKITKHLETNLFVASKITGCKYGIGRMKNGYEVRIEGISYSGIE